MGVSLIEDKKLNRKAAAKTSVAMALGCLLAVLAGCGGGTAEDLQTQSVEAESKAMAIAEAEADAQAGAFAAAKLPACPAAPQTLMAINAVQGTGPASPVLGQQVTVRGVVTGNFQATNQLSGFFIQEVKADKNPDTSEGVFIYAPANATAVKAGDYVQVSGKVEEFKSAAKDTDSLTEIVQLSELSVCGAGPAIKPKVLTLPVKNSDTLEAYEGMLVKFSKPLVVNDVHELGRYGQLTLGPKRLYQPYNHPTISDPAAVVDLNARSKIVLDDGLSPSNPNPVPFLSASDKTGTRRVGDTVENLQGILTWAFSAYRIEPTQPVAFSQANARPAAPQTPSGSITAGSLNVLNYFTTLNQRGANSPEELARQRDKLVTTIVGLNADVLGLMEIENNASTTLSDLISAVNAKLGANTYAYINSGKAGTDAIKVAVIYKPSKVTPIGAAVVPTDAGFSVDGGMRPPVAQRFFANNNHGSFWLVVNHLKSKGSCPDGANDINRDQGQGCWNAARVTQVATLKDWVSRMVTSSGESDVLMVGDFNSYLNEDPLASLEAGKFENLLRRLPAKDRYSYIFNGETGALDHAFASSSMKSQVRSATVWHVNADEPSVLDYNTEFKTDDRYDVTPFRSSDHDPVLVGLSLKADAAITVPTLTADLPTTAQVGGSVSISHIAATVANGSGSATLSVDWGDGSGPQALAANATTASKTYAKAGSYTITLLLTDGRGISTQLTGGITVAGDVNPGSDADLLFSEYVEGSSNNKALEIYNPTAAPIDLSLYKVKLYVNGALVPTSTQSLTGTIAPGATLTLVHASLSPAATVMGNKLVSSATNFNGNDAITLEKNGQVIDAVGQVGFDPGTAWTNGAVTTLNKTLRRKAGITQGSVPAGAWNPALEWDAYAIDTLDGLGLR